MTECERMNIDTGRWEQIASLNEPRCTSMVYVFKDKIYVAGGFFTTGKRLKSIEIYDPVSDIWYLCGELGWSHCGLTN